MTDDQFLNLVSLIAHKHKCTIKSLDLNERTIDIDGPSHEAMVDCANELDKLLN